MIAGKFLGATMTPRNGRRPPFDSVTIAFHWATVLIVLAMFATAWLHSQSHDHAFKAILLQIHRSLGVTIWVATALRLAWRLTNAKLPPFPQQHDRRSIAARQVQRIRPICPASCPTSNRLGCHAS